MVDYFVTEPASCEYVYEWGKGYYHMVAPLLLCLPTVGVYPVPEGKELLMFVIHEDDLDDRPPAYELDNGYVIVELPLPNWMESIRVGQTKFVKKERS